MVGLISTVRTMRDMDFQDRIDEYLLHGNHMPEEEKARFLREIAEDEGKREQYELTKTLKAAVTSRGKKLEAMARFQKARPVRRRTTIWASTAAAVLVAGFIAIEAVRLNTSGTGDGSNVRGGDDVFVPAKNTKEAADTAASDTATIHTDKR